MIDLVWKVPLGMMLGTLAWAFWKIARDKE